MLDQEAIARYIAEAQAQGAAAQAAQATSPTGFSGEGAPTALSQEQMHGVVPPPTKDPVPTPTSPKTAEEAAKMGQPWGGGGIPIATTGQTPSKFDGVPSNYLPTGWTGAPLPEGTKITAPSPLYDPKTTATPTKTAPAGPSKLTDATKAGGTVGMPSNGQYVVTMPDGSRLAYSMNGDLIGPASGAAPNTTVPRTGTNQFGTSQNAPVDLASLSQQTLNDLGSLRNMITNPAAPPDVMGMYLSGLQTILTQLDAREKQLRDDSLKEQTEIDPGTQLALDKMREQLKESLKATAESLNARGLFHSGILLDLESKIRKGALSDEAKVLADRLSGIKANLRTGLDNIGNQRFSATSQFALAGAQGQQSATQAAEDRRQQLINLYSQQQLALRGQLSAEQQAQLQRDLAAFQSNRAYDYGVNRDKTLDQQWKENYDVDKAKFNETIANQNRQAELDRQAAAARAVAGTAAPKPTQTQENATLVTNHYNQLTDYAYSQGQSPDTMLQNLFAVDQYGDSAASEILAQGGNLAAIVAYIKALPPRTTTSGPPREF